MKQIKDILSVFLRLLPILLLAATVYFLNNYYLGWLLYGFSILMVVLLIVAVIAAKNGIPAAFIPPFVGLLYLGNILIEHSNKEDGIIVNLEFLTPQNNDYIIRDLNIKAPNKILKKVLVH